MWGKKHRQEQLQQDAAAVFGDREGDLMQRDAGKAATAPEEAKGTVLPTP